METLVHIQQGYLQGLPDPKGHDVVAFLGIPFAAPPVGSNRWRPPKPPSQHSGILDCQSYRAIPIQQRQDAERSLFPVPLQPQSEDCLYLNIWTGAASRADHRPVIVWLQPGAFQSGAGSSPLCQGTALAEAGAVVVTLNYRLSRLGFFAHPDLTDEGRGVSGNFGLLDQIAALAWVRDNIASFGGDPGCVTLFGISSGASSASLLMASPLAHDLFHRVIAESGGSFGPIAGRTGVGDLWQDLPSAERSGMAWAASLEASSLMALRAVDADQIREASRFAPSGMVGAFDGIRPIVDGRIVPDSTHAIFEAQKQAPVPVLLGCAADEGLATVFAPDLESFLASARHEFGDRLERFLSLYPAATDQEAVAAGLRSNGHRLFTWQNWRWAHLHAASGYPTFCYRFDRPPPVPAGRYDLQRLPRDLGAFHAASAFYAFGTLESRDWSWAPADHDLSSIMVSTWFEFARSGVPGSPLLPHWPEFDPAAPRLMRLGEECVVSPPPEAEYLAFWDDHFGSTLVAPRRMHH